MKRSLPIGGYDYIYIVCASNGKRLTNIAILSEGVTGLKSESGLARE